MRKTAVFLLFCFFLLQAGPVISSFFSPVPAIVMIDEEKAEDKAEPEHKVKKDFSGYSAQADCFSQQLITAIHLAEQIQPFPCLEQHCPPPNKG